MQLKPGSIIHCDLDAFFASVEQLDRPELRGRPVLVGGSVERGVVSACSYEARRFGVHSAMAMSRALRLCPLAAVLPVRMDRYRELSARVFAVFARFTDRVEPLSIDEAFLDVSGCERLFGPPRAIAERLRAEVLEATGLTVSAGIAPNKFLAKLASEHGKPDGLVEIAPEAIDAFLLPLPLSRLWGVGRVTAGRLERQGLNTVADLRAVSRERLVRLLGSGGATLYRLARGEDDSPVVAPSPAKSIGHEETFAADLWELEDMRRQLLDMSERVARRLRRQGMTGRRVTLKVKYADFEGVTRSQSVGHGLDNAMAILQEGVKLLGRTEAGRRPVRLLGISLSALERTGAGQGELFGDEERRRLADLDRAVDRLRDRFGEQGVCRGTLLEKDGSGRQEGGDSGQGT